MLTIGTQSLKDHIFQSSDCTIRALIGSSLLSPSASNSPVTLLLPAVLKTWAKHIRQNRNPINTAFQGLSPFVAHISLYHLDIFRPSLGHLTFHAMTTRKGALLSNQESGKTQHLIILTCQQKKRLFNHISQNICFLSPQISASL